jgi:hypothetical protein
MELNEPSLLAAVPARAHVCTPPPVTHIDHALDRGRRTFQHRVPCEYASPDCRFADRIFADGFE